jgi:hypothetical protein
MRSEKTYRADRKNAARANRLVWRELGVHALDVRTIAEIQKSPNSGKRVALLKYARDDGRGRL